MKLFDSIIRRKNRVVTAETVTADETRCVCEETASKPRSKISHGLKKIAAVAASMAISASMFCVTAFADAAPAGGGTSGGLSKENITTFITSAQTAFTTVIALIGAALAFVGIFNYLEGQGSENDAAKAKGMKLLMAGLGIVALAFIAVPALFDLITTAMK